MNRMDVWARTGPPQPVFPWAERAYPVITGADIAGEVDAVASGTTGVRPGDRVVVFSALSCGRCEWCADGEQTMCLEYKIFGEHTQGGFAEYAAVPAANLEPLPSGVEFIAAAAAATSYCTAWRGVVTRGEVRPGDDVLVLAAGGGVGAAAIDIALRAGARVFAGASTEAKRAKAVGLGAAAAVDHTAPFSSWVLERTGGRGVDIVVDSLGATWPESIRSLARGGRLVVCGATLDNRPQFDIRELYQRHRSIRGAPMGNRAEFRRVLALLGQGALRPVIDSVFPLDRIRDAHRRAESREPFGKIVVTM
jgi:NADPH2:quinone reductase